MIIMTMHLGNIVTLVNEKLKLFFLLSSPNKWFKVEQNSVSLLIF